MPDLSVSDPVQDLLAAAATLRAWTVEATADRWAPSAVAAFGPDLAASFEAWAEVGRLDPDLLNRVGGPETIRAAREINNFAEGTAR